MDLCRGNQISEFKDSQGCTENPDSGEEQRKEKKKRKTPSQKPHKRACETAPLYSQDLETRQRQADL